MPNMQPINTIIPYHSIMHQSIQSIRFKIIFMYRLLPRLHTHLENHSIFHVHKPNPHKTPDGHVRDDTFPLQQHNPIVCIRSYREVIEASTTPPFWFCRT